MSDPTRTDFESLAAKLEALELSDAEAAILATVVRRAGGDEVEGFTKADTDDWGESGLALFTSPLRIARAAGYINTPDLWT